jgi:hypothetical protein
LEIYLVLIIRSSPLG